LCFELFALVFNLFRCYERLNAILEVTGQGPCLLERLLQVFDRFKISFVSRCEVFFFLFPLAFEK
jgi:hypothetical protein